MDGSKWKAEGEKEQSTRKMQTSFSEINFSTTDFRVRPRIISGRNKLQRDGDGLGGGLISLT